MSRSTGYVTGPATIRRMGALAAIVAATILVAALPALASVPAAPGRPRPMPAPAPLAMADFPEHVTPGKACVAILTRSSAVDNARSSRANDITSALLADACLGA